MERTISMIKAILFDLGGVCLSRCFGKENRKKIANKFSIPFDKMENLYKNYELDINTGKKEMVVFLNALKHLNPEIKVEEVRKYVRNLDYVDHDVMELLKSLKEKYILGVLNNESKEFNEFRKKQFNLNEFFDHFFSSCDTGFQKPDKKAFEFALSKLNLNSFEVIFIDDRKINVEVAKSLGINALLFRNIDNLKKEFYKLKIL